MFAPGDIVWVAIENTSDLSSKDRPVLVLASWPAARSWDYLTCVCSTRPLSDPYKVDFGPEDLQSGDLTFAGPGFIRPAYMHVVSESRFRRQAGRITEAKLRQVSQVVKALLP